MLPASAPKRLRHDSSTTAACTSERSGGLTTQMWTGVQVLQMAEAWVGYTPVDNPLLRANSASSRNRLLGVGAPFPGL